MNLGGVLGALGGYPIVGVAILAVALLTLIASDYRRLAQTGSHARFDVWLFRVALSVAAVALIAIALRFAAVGTGNVP